VILGYKQSVADKENDLQAQLNLKEIMTKCPQQIAKEGPTTIIKTLRSQNPALGNSHPAETDLDTTATGSLAVEESSGGLDDEYLPTCCRNGNPHHHPV